MMADVSRETECLTPAILMQIEQVRAGLRKHVHHGGTICSKLCGRPPASERDRYCKECRAADRKERRRVAKAKAEQNARLADEARRLIAVADQQSQKLTGEDNGQDGSRH